MKLRHCRPQSQYLRIYQPLLVAIFIFGIQVVIPDFAEGQNQENVLNLEQAIDIALKANLALLKSKDEIDAAQSTKNVQRSNLLPTFNTTYSYTRDDEARSIGGFAETSKNEYNWSASLTQPIFRGFDLINQYRIADLGLDAAEVSEKLTRLNVIFETKNAYFTVLKNTKTGVGRAGYR